MAKRAPANEKPFRALDKNLVLSVMSGPPITQEREEAVGGMPLSTPPRQTVAVFEAPQSVPMVHADPARLEVVPNRASAPRRVETPPAPAQPTMERREREKRVLLTRSEERDVERLVDRLAGELQTPIKLSHLLRATITMVLHAEEDLVQHARRTTLIRPGNGNAPELAEFEFGVTQILAGAFRDARPLRPVIALSR